MYVVHLWVRPGDCGQSWLDMDKAAEVLAGTGDGMIEHVYVPTGPPSERRGAIYLTSASAADAGESVLAAVRQLIRCARVAYDAELRHPAAFGLCDGVVVVSRRTP